MLRYDSSECESFAESMSFSFTTEDDPLSPDGCYLDTVTNQYIFNENAYEMDATSEKQKLCICQACPNHGIVSESQRSYSSASDESHSMLDIVTNPKPTIDIFKNYNVNLTFSKRQNQRKILHKPKSFSEP